MSKELAEAVKLFISQPLNNPLTRGQIMEIARIALPILEQQEQSDGWIEWDGAIDPCDEPVIGIVEVKFKGGETDFGRAAQWYWKHDNCDSDIIAYRIIPEQPTNQNGETS